MKLMCMPTRTLLVVLGCVLLVFGMSACRQDPAKKGVAVENQEEKTVEVKIKRYEQVLFRLDQAKLAEELNRIRPEYRFFIGDRPNEDGEVEQLKGYLSDPMIRALYDSAQKRYADLSWLEKDFSAAFGRYHAAFPKAYLPEVFTYISGVDPMAPVRVADSVILIGIDNFLGRSSDFYRSIGIPVYQSYISEREYILSNAMILMADRHLPDKRKHRTLLDWMIYSGKRQVFLDEMLPDEKDDVKIGYSPEQLEWCKTNEAKIWAHFIAKKLLYITDKKEVIKFVGEAPFTKGLGEDSPGRVGVWLGWQIVKAWRDKHPDEDLAVLFKETDSQKILQESGYRPGK